MELLLDKLGLTGCKCSTLSDPPELPFSVCKRTNETTATEGALGDDLLGEGGAAVAEQKYEPVALCALLEI